MTATAVMIKEVRRKTDELDNTTYDDAEIQAMIEKYPLVDERGVYPYSWDYSTTPPSQDANDNWIPTYDLNHAASDIWAEKAGTVASNHTFTADGATHQRNQVYENYMKQSRFYLSRRSPNVIEQEPYPYADEENFQTGH